MRLALISDLHANEIALEAVLEDAKKVGYDRLVCLGDVATLGPRPHAILARLQNLGCSNILGNHDEFMFDAQLIHSYTEAPVIVASVEATRASLSEKEIAFLRTFERTLRIDDENGEGVFLYHGTPRSNMEELLSITPTDKVDEMLGPHSASVLAGGHTHLQMLRQHRGMMLVNTGSLGMPFREHAAGKPPTILPHAEYAIVETGKVPSVDLRRVPLNKDALATQVDNWDNPLAKPLRASYA